MLDSVVASVLEPSARAARRTTLLVAVWWLAVGCGAEAPQPVDLGGPLEGAHLLVTAENGRVHVFDLETFEPVAEVEVGAGAGELRATADRASLWAVAGESSQVALIDASTLALRIVPVGARPTHSYLDPAGERVWVGNDGSADVSIVDLASATEVRALTGNGHHKIAFVTDAAGSLAFAYVSNLGDATISVLDPRGASVATIPVGPVPHGIDYSPATRRVYGCSGDAQNSIEVLDPFGASPHTIVSRIALPSRCGRIHVEHDDPGTAWAMLSRADLIARVDLATESVETFEAGPSPDRHVLTDERIWVASGTAPTLSVIDLASGERRAIEIGEPHVEDGRGHRSMLLDGDRIYVPNEHDGTVSVVDVASERVIATVEGVPGAGDVAVAGSDGHGSL